LTFDLNGLPGEALVRTGLSDLAAGRATPSALTLSTASDRLRQLGIELAALPPGVAIPRQCELALHDKLVETGELDPYARYNALLRELTSFLEAAEGRRRRAA
jgi:hypothetical protein